MGFFLEKSLGNNLKSSIPVLTYYSVNESEIQDLR